MSFHGSQQALERDAHRSNALLKAHLEAGEWKAQAWALADSLAWALSVMTRLQGTEELFKEADGAEYQLAQVRLRAAREGLK